MESMWRRAKQRVDGEPLLRAHAGLVPFGRSRSLAGAASRGVIVLTKRFRQP